jgi:hypothetical protein
MEDSKVRRMSHRNMGVGDAELEMLTMIVTTRARTMMTIMARTMCERKKEP